MDDAAARLRPRFRPAALRTPHRSSCAVVRSKAGNLQALCEVGRGKAGAGGKAAPLSARNLPRYGAPRGGRCLPLALPRGRPHQTLRQELPAGGQQSSIAALPLPPRETGVLHGRGPPPSHRLPCLRWKSAYALRFRRTLLRYARLLTKLTRGWRRSHRLPMTRRTRRGQE